MFETPRGADGPSADGMVLDTVGARRCSVSVTTVYVTVDHTRCVGTRNCVRARSDVFRLDDLGKATVIGPIDRLAAVDVAEGCPSQAIAVRDSETGEVLAP